MAQGITHPHVVQNLYGFLFQLNIKYILKNVGNQTVESNMERSLSRIRRHTPYDHQIIWLTTSSIDN